MASTGNGQNVRQLSIYFSIGDESGIVGALLLAGQACGTGSTDAEVSGPVIERETVDGVEVARGLVAHDADRLRAVAGRRSADPQGVGLDRPEAVPQRLIEARSDNPFAQLSLGDTLTLRGWCQGDGHRIGFGGATGKVRPAVAFP